MAVIEIIAPLIFIPLCGFFAAKFGVLSETRASFISKITFSLMVPLLLFITTATADLPENINWSFLAAFFLAVLIVYCLAVFLGRYFYQYNTYEQSIFAMGCSYSNITVLGIPICTYVLGNQSLLPLSIIISLHNLLLFLLGTITAERDSLNIRTLLVSNISLVLQILKTPITASLLLGLSINILDISIYEPIRETFLLISQGAIPMALFILGSSMIQYRVVGNFSPALSMLALKSIVLPLLVCFLSFKVFYLPTLWGATAVIASAMPTGISAYIFSKNYSRGEDLIGTGIILSTLFTILTMVIVISYIQLLN